MNILSTYNLSCSYKGQKALDSLNMKVPKGMISGLMGHNGSGKSTLFKAILNELEPSSGVINNNSRRTGFLIENGSYYEHLTAYENLKFHHYAFHTDKGLLYETLDLVGLSEARNKKVSEFSLGMKKRLSIAMSFASAPDLILLDEPTNELDPDGVVLLNQIMRKWNAENSTSIIYSSHIISEITKMCDYIFLLKEGNMIYQGYRTSLEEEINSPLENMTLEEIYKNLK